MTGRQGGRKHGGPRHRGIGIGAVLVALALALLVPAAAEAVVLSPTNFPLPGSNFQGGDGNQDNPTALQNAQNPAPYPATIDWQHLASQNLVAAGNDPDLNDTVIDGKENEPVNWDLTTVAGGSTPPKANFFASWNFVDNETFLYLAFDREQSGGNVFLAFELNQDTRLWKNNNNDFVPCRTDGDLIISYEIQNGSNIDIVTQEWDSTTTVTAAEAASQYTNGQGCAKTGTFAESDPGAANAQAAINLGQTIQNYLPRTPLATSFGPELFGEAALNVNGVFQQAGQNPCFSFGQISLHGRSSKSVSAALQDVVGPVPLILRSCTISGIKWMTSTPTGSVIAANP